MLLVFLVFAAWAPPLALPRDPESDPVLGPIIKAENEGRLVDAKKLAEAAIQEAETQSAPLPRLHLLLSRLAYIDACMGHPEDAVVLGKRVLKEDEEAYGPESLTVAMDLAGLGRYCFRAGDEVAAAQAFEQQLAIARKSRLGVVEAIANLSSLYVGADRKTEAEALLNEGVQVCDASPPSRSPGCPDLRSQLAELYRTEGRADEAQKIIADGAAQTAGDTADVLTRVRALNEQARMHEYNKDYDLAEDTYRQAMALIEKNRGREIPGLFSNELDNLGKLLQEEGRDAEAEELFKRALSLDEQAAESKRPELARNLPYSYLVSLYSSEGRLSEVESVLHEALALQERLLGPDRTEVGLTLLHLAESYRQEKRYSEAAPLYVRAIAIQEKSLGDDPRLSGPLDAYANLLREMGESDKAKAIAARADALRHKRGTPTLTPPADK